MAGRDEGIEVAGGGRVDEGESDLETLPAACVAFGTVELSPVVLSMGADDVCG